MSQAWAGGSSARWRTIRRTVLIRDGHRCRIKIKGVCTRTATCVHHTRGRAVTGDDPRYLVAACRPCNLKMGDPTRGPDPRPRPMTRW
jgi:5-methylcytosine-specific restriction endonuclease McrA